MFPKFPIRFRRQLIIAGIVLLIVAGWVASFYLTKPQPMVYGVSFSAEYAGYLQFDPKKVYKAILDDWKFRHIRIAAPWDHVEPTRGVFDFKETDWQMDEAAKHKAKIILTIGQKTPRWPECRLPDWATKLSHADYRRALEEYMTKVVERYKNHPALEVWQVENEPFLAFGAACPAIDPSLLAAEVMLVKKLDPKHPTMVTDSGELSTWSKTARAADLFGTTLYRVVWDKNVGYWNYDFMPPFIYRLKLWFNKRAATEAYVMELQAEPWIADKKLADVPLAEQYRSLSLSRLKKNIVFASELGFSRSYLWGAEWWYWLRERGFKEIPDFIATLNK